MTWQKNDWLLITNHFAEKLRNELKINKANSFIVELTHHFSSFFFSAFCELYSINIEIITSLELNDYKSWNLKSINNCLDLNPSPYIPLCLYLCGKTAHTLNVITCSREEFYLTRSFDMVDYELADLAPCSDFFISDMVEICKFANIQIPECFNEEILQAENLRWANMENVKFEIVSSDIDPTKNPRWLGYTASQQKLIAKIWSVEKETRYKIRTIKKFQFDEIER